MPERRPLRAKNRLALKGHDTASDLQWMLASPSAAIMPEPRIAHSTCEPFLWPMRHDIAERPDRSNLHAVFRWCKENDATCRDIARNGQRSKQMPQEALPANLDLTAEMLLHDGKNITLKPGPLHAIGDGLLSRRQRGERSVQRISVHTMTRALCPRERF